MDKLVDKIVALGVPGLVLLVGMAATGFAGAAPICGGSSGLGRSPKKKMTGDTTQDTGDTVTQDTRCQDMGNRR